MSLKKLFNNQIKDTKLDAFYDIDFNSELNVDTVDVSKLTEFAELLATEQFTGSKIIFDTIPTI